MKKAQNDIDFIFEKIRTPSRSAGSLPDLSNGARLKQGSLNISVENEQSGLYHNLGISSTHSFSLITLPFFSNILLYL